MRGLIIFGAILVLNSFSSSGAKIYERCEFARELQSLGVPRNQIATWTCIAQRESNYNTSARNWVSGNHGILQISEKYWCNVNGRAGKGCNAKCAYFRNSNIVDDIRCAQKVYNEHTRLSGNGLNAWTTYHHCSGDNYQYVAGCF